MRKQDWAREKVERLTHYENTVPICDSADVVKLLRAERARARRLVRGLRDSKGHTAASLCQPAYQLACDDILRRLK